jgi:hypothetical protein
MHRHHPTHQHVHSDCFEQFIALELDTIEFDLVDVLVEHIVDLEFLVVDEQLVQQFLLFKLFVQQLFQLEQFLVFVVEQFYVEQQFLVEQLKLLWRRRRFLVEQLLELQLAVAGRALG